MRVTTVKATIRYSAEAQGAWRSVELGAEATLTASDEDWQQCQQDLYRQLGQQLRTVWVNGAKAEKSQEAAESDTQGPPKEHWCVEHNQEWKKRTGPHGEFYSHKIQGTNQWCNEKK